MKRHLWLAVVVIVVIIAAAAVAAATRTSAAKATPRTRVAAKAAARYACPMHPEVTSATRDRCPKCGLFLEPIGR